jgi:hypothetical protein
VLAKPLLDPQPRTCGDVGEDPKRNAPTPQARDGLCSAGDGPRLGQQCPVYIEEVGGNRCPSAVRDTDRPPRR